MSWRLAPTLVALRDEINARYPRRDKTSDGTVGDLAHRNRTSDHNPDTRNVVCALDIDEDLDGRQGFHEGAPLAGILHRLLELAKAGQLPQLYYIVYERHIYSATYNFRKQEYHGSNPHDHHMHVSVRHQPHLADRAHPWNLFNEQEREDDMPTAKEVWDKDLTIGPSEHSAAWYIREIYAQLKGLRADVEALKRKVQA